MNTALFRKIGPFFLYLAHFGVSFSNSLVTETLTGSTFTELCTLNCT